MVVQNIIPFGFYMVLPDMETLQKVEWQDLEVYLRYDKKLNDNARTWSALKSRFLVIRRRFEDNPFTRDAFIRFLGDEEKRGISRTTLNKYISCVKHIAHYLHLTEFDSLTYFREKKKDLDPLSFDEMKQLAEVYINYKTNKDGWNCATQNLRMYCYVSLLAEVGCRQSEACNLKWSDLHQYYVIFRDTKNYDDRYCPITKELYDKITLIPKKSDKVFNLSEVSNYALQDLKRRQNELSMSKHIDNHTFRHSVATFMARLGANPILVAKLLGWKDINTYRRYEHLDLSDLENLLFTYSPIWQDKQTLELVQEKGYEFFSKFLNKKMFSLNLKVEEDEITFKIKKAR